MKTLLGFARLVLFWSAFGCLAQAGEPVAPGWPGEPAGSVMVPEGVAAPAVQKAILLAGTGRGWTVKSRAEGEVVLFLEHGGWRSTLTLTYNAQEVKIFSHSAKLNRKGQPKKYAVPENWVKFLKQDIVKQLGLTAFAG